MPGSNPRVGWSMRMYKFYHRFTDYCSLKGLGPAAFQVSDWYPGNIFTCILRCVSNGNQISTHSHGWWFQTVFKSLLTLNCQACGVTFVLDVSDLGSILDLRFGDKVYSLWSSSSRETFSFQFHTDIDICYLEGFCKVLKETYTGKREER